MVGDSFCRDSSKARSINDILITLIPNNACNNSDFRPISLCNISYEVVTKIPVQRLQCVMSSLVNPCQSSFVPNRQSKDSIIVAQEVFHSMWRKKGKRGWMVVIKLDHEKAYDCLNWTFMKDIVVDTGMPQNFVNLLWMCMTSSNMRVLWNGEVLDKF